jgi:phosphotransferase system IIB component
VKLYHLVTRQCPYAKNVQINVVGAEVLQNDSINANELNTRLQVSVSEHELIDDVEINQDLQVSAIVASSSDSVSVSEQENVANHDNSLAPSLLNNQAVVSSQGIIT